MASEPLAKVELEPPGVDLRPVLLAGAGAMLLLVAAIVAFTLIYRAMVPSRMLPPPQAFPEPQLRTNEFAQRLRLQADQRARLTGYAWADRDHGLVHIPIERAMRLIVEAGPKAYDPIEPSAAALASPTAGAERVGSGQAGGQGASPASAPNAAEPRP
jgi:hypothetical protein